MQPQLSSISNTATQTSAGGFSMRAETQGSAHPFRAHLKSLQENERESDDAPLAAEQSAEALSSSGVSDSAPKSALTPPDAPEIENGSPSISAAPDEAAGAIALAETPAKNEPSSASKTAAHSPASPNQQSGNLLPDGKTSPETSGKTLPQGDAEKAAKPEISVALPKTDGAASAAKGTAEPSSVLLVSKGNAQKAQGPRGSAFRKKAAEGKAAINAASDGPSVNKSETSAKALPSQNPNLVANSSGATATEKPSEATRNADGSAALTRQFFPKTGAKHDAKPGERVAVIDGEQALKTGKTAGASAKGGAPSPEKATPESADPKPIGAKDRPATKTQENSAAPISDRFAQVSSSVKPAAPAPAPVLTPPIGEMAGQSAPSFLPLAANSGGETSGLAATSSAMSGGNMSPDLESLVEKLVATRTLARADKGSLALNHPDFGKITVEFSHAANRSLGVDMPDAPAELRQAVAQNFAQNSAGNSAASASGGSRSDVARGDMGQPRSDQGASGRPETGGGQGGASENGRGNASQNGRDHAEHYGRQGRPSNSTQSLEAQALTTNGEDMPKSARGAWA